MTGWQAALVAAGHGVTEAGVAGGQHGNDREEERVVGNRAAPYVLAPGALRRHDAVLLFKVLGRDIGGLLSLCEFTLDPWESGPVLHRHTSVDEAFYMVAGRVAAQLNQRLQAAAGGFVWVPRAEDRAVG